MTIAITGATGQLGRLVVESLKARVPAGEILALVRDPAKAADLGVAARAADYTKAQTLGPALEGVDTLLLISGNEVGQRLPQHRAVIEAAQAAGVMRIAY
ncbi:MAG: NAD(P)-dependent oxidoreductase, partial [Phenylobacterium zucineum]